MFKVITLILALIVQFQVFGQATINKRISTAISNGFELQLYDLDGDGDLDGLTAAIDFDQILWYENVDDNRFIIHTVFTDEDNILRDIFAADLDNDGDLDIIATYAIAATVVWYENDGLGNFGEENIIGDEIFNPRAVRSADLDADGNMDIIVASSGDDLISWYKNLGDGSFGPRTIISDTPDTQPHLLELADMDGDGDIDIVAFLTGSDYLGWFENTGDGSFEAIDLVRFFPCNHFHLADLDGDGNIDILANQNSVVQWNKNIGDGTFETYVNIVSFATTAKSAISFDLDADGDLDVIWSEDDESILYWNENIGGGLFASEIALIETTEIISAIAIGLVNTDLKPDLVGISRLGNETYLFPADEFLVYEEEVTLSSELIAPSNVTMIDLDADGDLDLLTASEDDNKVAWFENIGSGTFAAQKIIARDATGAKSVSTGDIDGDGDLDVIAFCREGNKAVWYQNTDGQFSNEFILSEDIAYCQNGLVEDFDLDGDYDIVAIGGWQIYYFENMGDATFGPALTVSAELDNGWDVQAADADDDGDLDIIVSSSVDNKIAWHENFGDGTFSTENIISLTAGGPREFVVIDFDFDGDQDIILTCGSDDEIAWYENEGGWTFGEKITLASFVNNPLAIDVKDLDSDGDYDVLFGSVSDDKVEWIQNQGDLVFGPKILIANWADYVSSVAAGDLDGDGDPDYIWTAYNDNELAWQANEYFSPYQIRGTVFFDENGDGIRDTFDLGIKDKKITTTPDHSFSFSETSGEYYMNFDETIEDTYDVYIDDLSDHWAISTAPDIYPLEIEGELVLIDSVDFGLHPLDTLNELELSLHISMARCNTIVPYWINIKNKGTTKPTGTIALELHDSLDYFGSEFEPDSIVDQTIYWSYDTLNYFGEIKFATYVQMPGFLGVGDTIRSFASLNVDSLGMLVYSIMDSSENRLICAYDPNDKAASPAGVDSMGYIQADTPELEYLIRFQNTGTDTAFNIVITDTLDPNLDWSSMNALSASHDMTVNVEPSGEISFIFDNIMLPDSNVNELASHGYVSYTIDLEAGLPLGTVIENTAYIYFDANPAVITNSKLNTLYDCDLMIDAAIFPTYNNCENQAIYGYFPDSVTTTSYEWIIEDLLAETGNEFSWTPDTAGFFNLTVNLVNEFCTFDTTYLIQVRPEIPNSILDTLSICGGDSTLIFDTYQYVSSTYYDSLVNSYGCDSVLQRTLIVLDLPLVSFADLEDSIFCDNDSPQIIYFSPDDGIITGPGLVDNEFNPTIAGIGDHILYCTYEDGNGCTAVDSVLIRVVDCLGLEENDYQFTLYPNPFDTYTTLHFARDLNNAHTVIITDLLGQIVYQNNAVTGNDLKIESKNLGSGAFILSVFNANSEEVYSTKLIVQ